MLAMESFHVAAQRALRSCQTKGNYRVRCDPKSAPAIVAGSKLFHIHLC